MKHRAHLARAPGHAVTKLLQAAQLAGHLPGHRRPSHSGTAKASHDVALKRAAPPPYSRHQCPGSQATSYTHVAAVRRQQARPAHIAVVNALAQDAQSAGGTAACAADGTCTPPPHNASAA